jgi:hypothetical protein
MLTKLHQNGSFRQILRGNVSIDWNLKEANQPTNNSQILSIGLNQKRLSSYASDHHRTKVQILTENKATVDHLPQPKVSLHYFWACLSGQRSHRTDKRRFMFVLKGKWEDLNGQREKQNNIILAAGAGLFLLSLVVVSFQGHLFVLLDVTQINVTDLSKTKDLWSDMRWNPPYEKISKDFPGAKFTS